MIASRCPGPSRQRVEIRQLLTFELTRPPHRVLDARVYRWLFNGLHAFDIPGLSTHDLMRKLVMLPLLTAGFSLSVTGIILAKRRLSR